MAAPIAAGDDRQATSRCDFAAIVNEIGQLIKGPRRRKKRSLNEPKIDLTRLPAVGEHLLGRETELAQLDEAWADPAKNIISLVAWGGVGKSALTKHWLDRLAAEKTFAGRRRFMLGRFTARARTAARGRRMSFLTMRFAGSGRRSRRG